MLQLILSIPGELKNVYLVLYFTLKGPRQRCFKSFCLSIQLSLNQRNVNIIQTAHSRY